MTIEEAIKLLDDITSYCDFTDEYGDMIDSEPYYEALDLAIKALDQTSHLKDRPCEACEFHIGDSCSKWECVFKKGEKWSD
jgi:hypothetical protein